MLNYLNRTEKLLTRFNNLPCAVDTNNIQSLIDVIFEYRKLINEIKEDSNVKVSSLFGNLNIIEACIKKAKVVTEFNPKQLQYDGAKKLLMIDLTKLLNLVQ